MSYLRGAAGYLLVADGTRAETLDVASSIQSRVKAEIGRCPSWSCSTRLICRRVGRSTARRCDGLEQAGWSVVRTSAKTGAGVEEVFEELAKRMVS